MSFVRSPAAYLIIAIILFGGWMRLPDAKARARKGVDEAHYERYVESLGQVGIAGWPQLMDEYIARQTREQYAFLPPTRILFLASAYGVHTITGSSAIEAVRWTSFGAAIATLIIGACFAWRMSGPRMAVGVTALLASSPLLIHLARRALIDGFFAFWALLTLWALWECLQNPKSRGWLLTYGGGIAAMILTKENAAFVGATIAVILLANRWLRLGTVTRETWAMTLGAPLVAGAVLVALSGGVSTLLEAYRLNVSKSVILPYAIATGDGPWHRYLLDFLLLAPAVTLLAIVAIGRDGWQDSGKRFMVLFIVGTYILMAQVRYGMNMRYGAMWEYALAWLAVGLLVAWTSGLRGRWPGVSFAIALSALSLTQLHQYQRLFVAGNVYDPVAGAVTQPLQMYKPGKGR